MAEALRLPSPARGRTPREVEQAQVRLPFRLDIGQCVGVSPALCIADTTTGHKTLPPSLVLFWRKYVPVPV